MHIHMALGASLFRKFPFFALARTFNKVTVVHLHDFDSRFKSLMGGPPSLGRALCTLMLRNADRVVALSRSWEQIILRYVPAARTCCLPNPYRLPPGFQPANRTGCTVLYLNRIESRKGYEHLLGAIPEVLKRCPHTTFVVAGHGDIVSARRTAADLGVEHAVNFTGWVEGDRKWRLLAEADILCLPSFAEGVPITLLEAMGAGVAVVTSPVGGIPDVVKDGENGILVQPGDVSGIAESLIRLLTDADLRGRLSDAGRRTVEKTNSLPVVDNALKHLYAELQGAALNHSGQVNTIRS
jgi:glycosyltransferase involved in cell wall biosynthesis